MKLVLTLCLALLPLHALANISARSWLVADENLVVQDGKNYQQVRSIASLTKLLTVMAAINDGTARPELVDLAMVRSSNLAADQLCRNHSQGYRGCIRAMNQLAQRIGAHSTVLTDATGLSPGNRSTAKDIARIVLEARRYPAIVDASNKHHIWYNRRAHLNTNPLASHYNTVVGKTGWTLRAGGCIAVLVDGRIYVLLGSRDTHSRVRELRELLARYSHPAIES
jgi:D-alanyl-D-alanine endopeptidase (penicillin-binding protein 7)